MGLTDKALKQLNNMSRKVRFSSIPKRTMLITQNIAKPKVNTSLPH